MYSINEAKLLKSVHVVNLLKFRLNGLNSDQIQTTIGQIVQIQTKRNITCLEVCLKEKIFFQLTDPLNCGHLNLASAVEAELQ